MLNEAYLDVRVLPWRARPRVMNADTFRDVVFQGDPIGGADDLGGVVIGLAVWIGLIIAAPVIVLVLAVALLSVELPVVLALAALLVVLRFTGIIPWTVLLVDQVNGETTTESYRFLPSALRRIRTTNHERRVHVRWHWV